MEDINVSGFLIDAFVGKCLKKPCAVFFASCVFVGQKRTCIFTPVPAGDKNGVKNLRNSIF